MMYLHLDSNPTKTCIYVCTRVVSYMGVPCGLVYGALECEGSDICYKTLVIQCLLMA